MSEAERELRELVRLVDAEHDRVSEQMGEDLDDRWGAGVLEALVWASDLIEARIETLTEQRGVDPQRIRSALTVGSERE